MEKTPDGSIVSKAHDWRDWKDNIVICARCKASTKIGNWDIPRCIPHYESAGSGFEDESDGN